MTSRSDHHTITEPNFPGHTLSRASADNEAMTKDMQTRMRRILAWGEQRDKVYLAEMQGVYPKDGVLHDGRDFTFHAPSPESTPATLGDLQAVERANALLAERIARLEAQVARIPGFLAAMGEVPDVPE